MKGLKAISKKVWHFIWEEDSVWSWLANIVIAFILIKFIVYPVLGLMFQTTHPVVAVVSESMEHDGNFDAWWQKSSAWYTANGISQEQFASFPMKRGFNKGDIMVLRGKNPESIEIGDIVVFWSSKKDPIIHRVVKKWEEKGAYYFQTKGDNYITNPASIKSIYLDETKISQDQIIGNAVIRVPFLGYIKIWFVDFINLILNLFSQKS